MSPNLFDIGLVILATWRLTSIINREYIAKPIRKVFGETTDAAGLESYPGTFFGYLISCFKCLSVWIALLTLIVWYVCPYILWPFAVSAGAIIMERFT